MESLLESKLALNLATMEIIHQPNIRMNVEIQNVILDQIFWENLEVLFQILNEFVIGIRYFESDIPRLSEFYSWYKKSIGKISMFIFKKKTFLIFFK